MHVVVPTTVLLQYWTTFVTCKMETSMLALRAGILYSSKEQMPKILWEAKLCELMNVHKKCDSESEC